MSKLDELSRQPYWAIVQTTGYADFTDDVFPRLANQNRGHSHVMLKWPIKQH